MKTIFKTVALLALMVMSNSSFALGGKSEKAVSSELDVQIRPLEGGTTLVKFNKIEGEMVRVKIFDSNGILVYSEKDTTSSSFAKKYNLSALPSGKYIYTVANNVYSVRKVIEKK